MKKPVFPAAFVCAVFVFAVFAVPSPVSAERQSGGAMPCPSCDPPPAVIVEPPTVAVSGEEETPTDSVNGLNNPEDYHDCTINCDRLCQEAIESNHFGEYGTDTHCMNGAPGTGAQTGICEWDWIGPTKTSQICTFSGCTSKGVLRCVTGAGVLVHKSYEWTCSRSDSLGGMPAQSVSKEVGVCSWPDGTVIHMACDAGGSITFF